MEIYKHLFAPGLIGNLKTKNRVIMAPMTTGYASAAGEVTERLLNYYRERAMGGVGTIIVEAAIVDEPVGREGLGQICLDHPQYIPGLQRLSRIIKAYDCRAFIQLLHAGRQTTSLVTGGILPVAPSALPCKMIKEIPRELSLTEIQDIIDKFVNAAQYAYQAGFEGVELHAAHGYLLNQFLSTESNRRSDEYGGSLENRAQMLLDICKDIKTKIPGLSLSVRLNIDDFTPEGLKIPAAQQIAVWLQERGVDIINCSAGVYESGLNCIEPASYDDGWRIYLAAAIKERVSIPVMAGGMIRKPALAEKIIAEKQADFIFIGRSLLADSQWVNKARTGNSKGIRPCIICNTCIGSHYKGHSVSCAVNPFAGQEGDLTAGNYAPVSSFHTAVIGGGPAGMQAAIALRRQGISVTLYEKSATLGGMLKWAALPPHKERINELKDYLIRQLNLSGAEVLLGHAFTAIDCQINPPDYIVMATGSKAIKPAIQGWDEQFCWLPGEVYQQQKQVRNRRVIVIGGGSNGCELAGYLLQFDNQVIIVEEKDIIAHNMERKNRRAILESLHNGQVILMKNCRVLKIEPGHVTVVNFSGGEKLIAADVIIAAVGFEADQSLLKKIPSQFKPYTFAIGDAVQPTGIQEALLQGEMAAETIIRQARDNCRSRY